MAARTARLPWVLRALARHHAPAPRPISTDPFRLILWRQVAYLVPEAARRAAYRRLQREVGLTPAAILAAPAARLRAIARAGGTIAAAERAARMRRSARLVRDRWGGSLRRALALPLARARRALTAFPMIGEGEAERILAIGGAHAVLGLDSNGLRVLQRLGWGREGRTYAATYRAVQRAVTPELSRSARTLALAAVLLQRHGETLCRRTAPRCAACPLVPRCPYGRRQRAAIR